MGVAARTLRSSSQPPATCLRHLPSTSHVVQRQTLTPLRRQYQAFMRCYSSTPPSFKKKDDDDDELIDLDDIEMMADDNMTKEEARKIIEEELALMKEEHDEKFAVSPEDWKPGMRKRKLVSGRNLEDFEREMYPERFEPEWTLRDKRCGLLAIKVGMMPIWDPVWGERIPTTVLFVDSNIVLGHKTMEKHGYLAVQVAAGQRKRKNVGKCVLGQYKEILQYDPQENPPYLVREFRVTDPSLLPPLYSRLHARHFVPGQNLDVSGTSKGKGFQGPMKRHNFGGMPASHGTSLSHRAHGAMGGCQDPGRVFKGKKMAGRMGNDRVTVQNLRLVKIDRGRNVLFVKGHVPGNKGGWVEIRDAVKKPLWKTDLVEGAMDRPPLPTYDYSQDLLEAEELEQVDGTSNFIDGSGIVGHELFMPIGDEDPLDPDYRNTLTSLPIKEE